MVEKNIKTRIVNKHDTEANWNKATTFIPKQGEIIVYDADDNYNYERLKIGDGATNVVNLPFVENTGPKGDKGDKGDTGATGSVASITTTGNGNAITAITLNSDKTITATKGDTFLKSIPTATSSVLGGVKTGSNITNTSGTISLTKANVTSALGYTPPTTNTTYGVATSSVLGLVKSGTDITVDSSGNVSVVNDSHTHNTQYYTKSEVNTLHSDMKKATMQVVTDKPTTGEQGIIYLVGSATPYRMWIYESDWIDLGDLNVNLSDYYTKTQVDSKITDLDFSSVGGSGKYISAISQTDGKISATATAIPNYAGSSSVGGAATSALKLSNTSAIGGTTKPVYFKADGTPATIGYTISADVPSGAKFTDAAVLQKHDASAQSFPILFRNTPLSMTTTGDDTDKVLNNQYIYVQPDIGTIFTKKLALNAEGDYRSIAEVTFQYNSTAGCLELVFA